MEQAKEAQLLAQPVEALAGRSKLKTELLMVLITAIWGSTFLIVKDTITLTGPFTFLTIRFGVGAIVLALVFRNRLKRITRAEVKAGLVIGVFLFTGYAFQTTGLQQTTSSKAGFITGLYVPMVPIFAILLLKQYPALGAVLGMLLSVLGLGLLSVSSDFNLQFGLGEILVLGCAVAFAVHLVCISKFAPKADALNLAIVQIALTSLLSFVAIPIAGESWVMPPLEVWVSATAMGILATALALAVMNRAQQFISSTRAALIYALEPVFAGILGVMVGESLSVPGWVGCVCIFAGMICAELKFPMARHKLED